MRNIYLFESIATLVGTIIGAGILGIPYVFSQAGFWTGTVVLIVVALVFGSSTITGNFVEGLGTTNTSLLGIVIFICGLLGLFIYVKKK